MHKQQIEQEAKRIADNIERNIDGSNGWRISEEWKTILVLARLIQELAAKT